MAPKNFPAKIKYVLAALAIVAAIAPMAILKAQSPHSSPNSRDLQRQDTKINNSQLQQTQSNNSNNDSTADNDIAYNPSFSDMIRLACSVPSLKDYRQKVSITTWDIKGADTDIPQISGPGATMDFEEFCQQMGNATGTDAHLGQINFRY